jgi:hypothetical protein
MNEETLVDPAAVIHLIGKLLPFRAAGADGVDNDQTAWGGHPKDNEEEERTKNRQEEAGCVLWDLAAMEESATIMAVG